MSERKTDITRPIVILIVCYILGLAGLGFSSTQDRFKIVIPLNIIITFAILLYYQKQWNLRIIFFLFFLFITSFIIEAVGVRTNLVFGEYKKYSDLLGPSPFGTPIIMGFYWVILIYSVALMMKNTKYNFWLQTLFASILLLMLDVIVDPPVDKGKKPLMWTWSDIPTAGHHFLRASTPFLSYIAWFAISFPLVALVLNLKAKLRNDLAPYVFLIMMGFYLLANLF